MEKIKEIIKKVMTKEIFFYIVFGVSTTIINLVVFYVLNEKLKINENIANIIAILCAVIMAYITNKDLVFHSEAKGYKQKIAEFCKFMGGRAFTMVVEWGLGALLFLTPINKMISKIFVTVVVIIINYFFSKFIVFRHKKK